MATRKILSDLLAQGKLRRRRASAKEIVGLFKVVDRDLADAKVSGISNDRRFMTAYNAALQAGRTLLASVGYRTAGSGHHATVFHALRGIIPASKHVLLDYFDDCRSKMNMAEYTGTGIASKQEADDLLGEARKFAGFVRGSIKNRRSR